MALGNTSEVTCDCLHGEIVTEVDYSGYCCNCEPDYRGRYCDIFDFDPYHGFIIANITTAMFGCIILYCFFKRFIVAKNYQKQDGLIYYVHMILPISVIAVIFSLLDYDGYYSITGKYYSVFCQLVGVITLHWCTLILVRKWIEILNAKEDYVEPFLSKFSFIFSWITLVLLSFLKEYNTIFLGNYGVVASFLVCLWQITFSIGFIAVALTTLKQVSDGTLYQQPENQIENAKARVLTCISLLFASIIFNTIEATATLVKDTPEKIWTVFIFSNASYFAYYSLFLFTFNFSFEPLGKHSCIVFGFPNEKVVEKLTAKPQQISKSEQKLQLLVLTDRDELDQFLGSKFNNMLLLNTLASQNKSKLLFYLSVDKLLSEKKKLLGNSMLIYQKYIKEGAPVEIYLPGKLKKQFKKKMGEFYSSEEELSFENVPIDLFKEAQEYVVEPILPLFKEFQCSEEYLEKIKAPSDRNNAKEKELRKKMKDMRRNSVF